LANQKLIFSTSFYQKILKLTFLTSKNNKINTILHNFKKKSTNLIIFSNFSLQ
jgi:hypothetical protein